MDKEKLESLLIPPGISLKQAIHKLNETAGRILFVVDDGRRLLGTITDGDIRRGIINNLEFSDRVEKIMSRNFVFVSARTPNIEACARQQMIDTGIEQVPVLDDNGLITDVVVWTNILEGKSKALAGQLHPNLVVIMAGGKGARLDPFTRVLPKPLIPIGDRPVIELIMEKFYSCGFHRFLYTLNYKKEYIKAFLRENKYPYEIEWIEEPDYLGTAGSLSLLNNKIGDSFFVTNCDSLLTDIDFADILAWHREHKADLTIVGCHQEFRIPFGVLEMSNGRLKRIREKPVHDLIINTGVYVLEPGVLEGIPSGGKADMNEVIEQVSAKGKVTVYPIYGNWLDIGQWEEYNKTVAHLQTVVRDV